MREGLRGRRLSPPMYLLARPVFCPWPPQRRRQSTARSRLGHGKSSLVPGASHWLVLQLQLCIRSGGAQSEIPIPRITLRQSKPRSTPCADSVQQQAVRLPQRLARGVTLSSCPVSIGPFRNSPFRHRAGVSSRESASRALISISKAGAERRFSLKE